MIFTPAVVPDIVVGTWDLAWLVMYVNAASAFFYAYNLDLLERVPKLGPYLRRARMNAVVQLQEHPWVRRLATFGVGLFVFSPLPGSGSFGGCLAGRIVGLTAWASFVIVSIAGAFVAVGYAAGGRALEKWLDANDLSTPVRVAGALVAIALVSLLVTIVRRLARAPLPSEAEGTGGEAATDDA
ncbi:MAG: small multi-drug export protein [Planctomycetota bacterium]